MTLLVEALVVNAALAALAIGARLVRASAAPGGLLVGTFVYVGAGRGAFGLLLAFFATGVALTKLGYREKAARGLAEPNEGRRGSAHAIANGGTAMLLALLCLLWPEPAPLLRVGIAGSLAAALADTAGSEIGQLYGRHAVSPLTFRAVPPGTEGAVSREGTLASLAAAALIGGLGWLFGAYAAGGALAAWAGGVVGSSLESVLGSVGLTRRLGHMALNLGNTLVGAASAMALARLVAP